MAAAWPEHTVWWHVYPLGFCGAPIREEHPAPAHRLRRLLGWLDYAVRLGASGLLLGPIFASRTHGYDTLDYWRIDPRLGDGRDFRDLVRACRERGLHLALDGVFGHVSDRHPLFRRALAEGPGGEAARLFDVDWSAEGGPRPRVFEGHAGLVRLRHRDPATARMVGDVLRHWLGQGVDGFRLDAAYSVDPAFWARVLGAVRRDYPAAWFLGEVIHGDYAQFVRRSGVDTVTQYELWKAVWSSIANRNLFELDWALGRHNAFLERFVPQTFVGNHDVTRLASRVGAGGVVVATAILMTVGGEPSVYYGDEQAFTGVKEERLGGDDAVRPAFPDAPSGLAGWGWPVYRAHQDLIGLRRRHPWLVRARTERVELANTRYVYRAVSPDGAHALRVELDVGERARAEIREDGGALLWRSRA